MSLCSLIADVVSYHCPSHSVSLPEWLKWVIMYFFPQDKIIAILGYYFHYFSFDNMLVLFIMFMVFVWRAI